MDDELVAQHVLNLMAIYDEPHDLDALVAGIGCPADTVSRVVEQLRGEGLVKRDEYELTTAGEQWLDDRFLGRI